MMLSIHAPDLLCSVTDMGYTDAWQWTINVSRCAAPTAGLIST